MPADDSDLPGISVVMVAHNDADWLRDNLVYLLEQDYPDFEVVVVDYMSQDDTPFVLKLCAENYPHLKVVSFKEDVNLFQGKKYPLSIGIKSAKNNILLFADPDCVPNNFSWLRGMVKGYFRADIRIVLGFCGIKECKSLFGLMQQYDNLAYSANYLGAALLGHPYTGSGRNLSYKRDFFFKKGAFISHYDIAEGADDLFVYQNAKRRNTAVCIEPDACLAAEPRKSFAKWHEQRLNRQATRGRHSLASRIPGDLRVLSLALFYASAVMLLLNGSFPWQILVALLAMKFAWQIISFSILSRRFGGHGCEFLAPFFEIYFWFANNILALTPLHNNRKFKQ
ncbi:MAG: glycosyltransferase [Bacteroidales bacterium]|nr:glycosyltransferase [Bacteroidales bacterium]